MSRTFRALTQRPAMANTRRPRWSTDSAKRMRGKGRYGYATFTLSACLQSSATSALSA